MLQKYFNTEVFRTPENGSPGSSGRGILSGPALVNTDLAILKEIRVREGFQFQLRGEFFNVFNQVNFKDLNTRVDQDTFGTLRQASPPRELQVGLRLDF